MLTKMRLENFKSWRELDLDLSNITILFGTNSSGKSSVLQSLLLLKQTAMGFDRKQAINLGGSETDYVDFGSYNDLVFKHIESARLGIFLDWFPYPAIGVRENRETRYPEIGKYGYSAHWQRIGDTVVLDQLDYDLFVAETDEIYIHSKWYKADRYTYEIPETVDLPHFAGELQDPDTVYVRSCYSVPTLVPQNFNMYPNFQEMSFSRQFAVLMGQIAYLGPLRDYPSRTYIWRGTPPEEMAKRGGEAIALLLASERNASNLLREVAEWLVRLELVADFQIKSLDSNKRFYEPRVKTGDKQVENSLIDVGFGISQVLPVITLLFSVPEGSIVLLEHPELHLHPRAQSHLADLLLAVAEKRNLQLIVESHSEHLLRRLQRRIAEAENKFATPENLKLYFCELENGESKLRPVEIDKYGQLANWPKDFFGDISGDLDALTDAALDQRRQELLANG